LLIRHSPYCQKYTPTDYFFSDWDACVMFIIYTILILSSQKLVLNLYQQIIIFSLKRLEEF